jgi:hypothetical protein
MEKIPTNPSFINPDLAKERGEIGRVAQEVFSIEDPDEIRKFGERFLEAAKTAPLVELSEEMWSQLENTDSYGIPSQDWAVVEDHAVVGHADHPRDWESLKRQYEQGASIEAPVIVKTNDTLHLVAGNTRLMVARALGITPNVLLVKIHP